jgi:hypothetical protein
MKIPKILYPQFPRRWLAIDADGKAWGFSLKPELWHLGQWTINPKESGAGGSREEQFDVSPDQPNWEKMLYRYSRKRGRYERVTK